MAIVVHQIATRVVAGPSAPVSFASTPTPGRHAIVLAGTNPNYAFAAITGWSASDNQGNSYDATNFCVGQDNSALIGIAPIVTAAGTFTATVTPTGSTTPDARIGVTMMEVSGLDGTIDTGFGVTINDALSYSSQFNFVSGTSDTAEELQILLSAPRSFGSYNDASSAIAAAGLTELYDVLSGDGAGFGGYRITSAAGTLTCNFGAIPNDGSPSLILRGLRAAAAAPSGGPQLTTDMYF